MHLTLVVSTQLQLKKRKQQEQITKNAWRDGSPKNQPNKNSNSTTILSHHLYMYFLCYFVKYAHHKTLYMHISLLTSTIWMHSYIPTRHSGMLLYSFPHTPVMSAILSSIYVSCCHPQQNSLSKDINMPYTPSTTHSTAFHKPPMHTTNTSI